VQVALTDITARKKAEGYLEFLGRHDVLTKLYNRSYYVEELNRLERKKIHPVTVIAADLNGLKMANDKWGHAVGDALLRRAGEVLSKAVDMPSCAARIGGDEFVLLMPGKDADGGHATCEEISRLIDLNNQFYTGAPLSLAMGCATSIPGEPLEDTVRRADLAMYDAKSNFYSDPNADRGHAQEPR
jgi:diguanylate cyclase (GGDEF)-like protein